MFQVQYPYLCCLIGLSLCALPILIFQDRSQVTPQHTWDMNQCKFIHFFIRHVPCVINFQTSINGIISPIFLSTHPPIFSPTHFGTSYKCNFHLASDCVNFYLSLSKCSLYGLRHDLVHDQASFISDLVDSPVGSEQQFVEPSRLQWRVLSLSEMLGHDHPDVANALRQTNVEIQRAIRSFQNQQWMIM